MILCSNPRAQYESYKTAIESAIRQVLSGSQYILGNNVRLFEREFAAYVGAEHAIGVGSGTDAIFLVLRAMDIGSGDEVIAPSHTAVATIASICMSGAKPVLVDVGPENYTLDPESVKKAISDKTKAMIPVHLYGHPADMDRLCSIASQHDLKVIEDCAQAHGAYSGNLRVGSIGDAGCFSFYPTKNLGALGDGGMVVTKDSVLSGRIRRLTQYGWDENRISHESGWNSRLDEIQAAVLRVKLPYLDRDNEKRLTIARRYNEGLKNLPVGLPSIYENKKHVYHLYVIECDRRNDLLEYLKAQDIFAGIHYTFPVHQHPAYSHYVMPEANFKNTDRLIHRILSLPIYPEFDIEDQNRVISAIEAFYQS